MLPLLAVLLVLAAMPFLARKLYGHEITYLEIGLNILIVSVVSVTGWQLGRYAKGYDHEILNGQVLGKQSEKVSCSHSYSCHCHMVSSGSGKNRSSHEECDTCYEHAYDINWVLKTSLGDIDIDRIDRQGLLMPPRFTVAQTGDPVAKSHLFLNYVKAAPDSLFNTLAEKSLMASFKDVLLPYPNQIYDYHYVNRVLTQGVSIPNLGEMNRKLADSLRTLGPEKQVNLIVVFTAQTDPNYAQALRAAWLGGKKNDVVVVAGTPHYPKIDWVRVFSWSDSELFKVELRDDLQSVQSVGDAQSWFDLIGAHIGKNFTRKSMKDFEYLAYDIEPPSWVLVLLLFFGAALSWGLSHWFANN